MRKLTGLVCVAAAAGIIWWQLPNQTTKTVSAQTGQGFEGELLAQNSSFGRSRSSSGVDAAYASMARKHMRTAQQKARQGDIAGAKRAALQAHRFNVQWAPGELTPQELISQLDRSSRPTGLNPSAISSGSLRPITNRDRRQQETSGIRPIDGAQNAIEPIRQASVPRQPVNESPFAEPQPIAQPDPFADSVVSQPTNPGPRFGTPSASTPQSFAQQQAAPVPSTGAVSPIRKRVDQYMKEAYVAWRKGDTALAIRKASVAELLAEGLTFRPGEETPRSFMTKVRSGQPATDTSNIANANQLNPIQPVNAIDVQPKQQPIQNPVAETPVVPDSPFVEPGRTTPQFDGNIVGTPEKSELPAINDRPKFDEPRTGNQIGDASPFANPPKRTEPQVDVQRQLALKSATERREYAKGLMQAARADMKNGRIEAAYEKALMAEQVDVTWNLFDEKPNQLIAEINRRQQQTGIDPITLANKSATPQQSIGTVQPSNDQPLVDVPSLDAVDAKAKSDGPFAQLDSKQRAVEEVPAGPISQKQYSQQLLAEARKFMRQGLFNEARANALKAQSLGLEYSLFEDRPDAVIKAIDAQTGTQTLTNNIARNNPDSKAWSPFDETTPKQSSPLQDVPSQEMIARQQERLLEQKARQAAQDKQEKTNRIVQSMLSQARSAMEQGNFAQAKSIVAQADQMGATYGVFDQRPDLVLKDIARLESQAQQPAISPIQPIAASEKKDGNPFENATPEVGNLTQTPTQDNPPVNPFDNVPIQTTGDTATVQQAKKLVAEARQLLQSGQLDAAQARAEQAAKLNVTYGLFDDQPKDILAAIAQAKQPATVPDVQANPIQPNENPAQLAALQQQREQAQQLLEAARADMKAGRFADAEAKALAVDKMNLTFAPLEDRPAMIFADLAAIKATRAQLSPTQQPDLSPTQQTGPESLVQNDELQNKPNPFEEPNQFDPGKTSPIGQMPQVGSFTGDDNQLNQVTTISPTGDSAETLFAQGKRLLLQGDQQGAYQAFLASYQSGQRLDPYKSQQLQDYLRDLSPRRNIQLVAAQDGQPGTIQRARPIDVAEQRDMLRFDRLRSEVLNAVLRADSLKETRPDDAIELIDKAMAQVENSGFDKQRLAPVVNQLRRSRGSIEGYIAQRKPIVDMQRRNDEVKAEIQRQQKAKIRVEQEFAALVDDFNRLYDEKRFAEAHILAQQARELDPENPVAVTLFYKSQIASRVDQNERLREQKDNELWDVLNDVERGFVNMVGDDPVRFPDGWKALTDKRRGRYRNDNRKWSEEEIRIQKSLGDKISLNYENAPLVEILNHLRTAADININVDIPSIEEEGVTTDTLVTINVNNIKVKSALNLILKPLHLGYTIEDEVLKVTSRIKQQGRLVPAAYPVADLVVSLRQRGKPTNNIFGSNLLADSTNPMGGIQSAGQFQVPPGGVGSDHFLSDGLNAESLSGPSQQYDFDTLIDLITSVVEPDSWLEVGGGGTIRSNETTLSLVIRQTQEVHQEISDLLDQLRRLQDLQVTIEVRLVSVSDRFFERIGIDFDFDVQDSVGGPDFDGGGAAGGGGGGGAGGGGGQNQQGTGGPGNPLPPFGSVIGAMMQNQQGGQGGAGGQAAQGGAGAGGATTFFNTPPARELTERDRYPNGGTIIGLAAPGAFTQDLDIQFQQGSFDIGVPDFGNFMPNAGLQVGLAILSDIETFFFIQAAQGDERANLLFAPKVTLFNGDTASVTDNVQRPFVLGLQPQVGPFSVGFAPQIGVIPDGINLSVTAVISADRRFVRLAMAPNFTNLIDLQTFSFLGGGAGGGAGGGLGGGGLGGGGLGGGGLGGGGLGGGGLGGGGFGGGGLGGGGGFGGGLGGFGVGGIGGGPSMMANNSRRIGQFGSAITGMQLVQQMNPQAGFGGIGGFGGGGLGGGGLGGGGGGFGGGGFGGGGGGAGGFGGGGGQAGGALTATVQQPVIATIAVQTSVSVPDGGTVLLGGVKRLREGRNMAGVPILNKIPYISRLFKNSGVGRDTESLMLMVTPRIVIYEEEEELLGIELD